MYVLLTGQHPLREKGEKADKYVAKLSNPIWKFPPEFSLLARSLFLQLVKVDPLERYAANEATVHPWITRKCNPIPLSYVERTVQERAKTKLNSVLIINLTHRFSQEYSSLVVVTIIKRYPNRTMKE